MRPRLALILLAIAALAGVAPRASAAVHLTPLGSSFSTPVYVAAPPGDPTRLFVVEKRGTIMEIRDGQLLPTPFLDITPSVRSTGTEQGLLSMAFAPDYATSHRFYVYYTAPGTGAGSTLTVERFQTSAADPDVADVSSRHTLLTIAHPDNANHNGGQLQFGPDGMLYAGTGDGGSSNDPPGNAQNPNVRLGKLLRIDPATGSVAIHALGLRNPWRFSFDRQTGDLVIGDVGQDAYEEVDFEQPATPDGINYGWRCYEGFHRTSNACTVLTGMTQPVLEQPHPDFCAIVGGYVVRDPALAGLSGRYVYGDNCNTAIHAVTVGPASASGDAATGLSVTGLTSFGEDYCGHVYATSGGGTLYRIDGDTLTPCPVAATPPAGGGPGGPGGPSGPGGLGGATPPPSPDRRAPALGLSVRHRQRVLRQHGLRVSVRCDEVCGVALHGTIKIQRARKRYGLLTATRQLAAGRTTKVTVRFSKGTRRAVAKALRAHRRVAIQLSALVRDAAGNERRASRGVRAVR